VVGAAVPSFFPSPADVAASLLPPPATPAPPALVGDTTDPPGLDKGGKLS
jgi:hypothetical protein